MLTIELPKKDIETLFGLGARSLPRAARKWLFLLNPTNLIKKLVEAGGWLAYADKNY